MTTEPLITDHPQPLDSYFLHYQEIVHPMSWCEGVPDKRTADNALDFLQYQFVTTAPSVYNEFCEIWNDGEPQSSNLSLRNVAFYYNFEHENHQKAVEFLNGKVGDETRQRFHNIWFGQWWSSPDWSPPRWPFTLDYEIPGHDAAPLDQYLLRYQEILKPTSPSESDVPSKAKADKAFDFLQKQYEETDIETLKSFCSIWYQDNPSEQPLSFRNIAYYYKPDLAHHKQAIDYLTNHLSPNTYQWFADIWTGKRQWDG
jgi:hypothetical protein